MSRMFGERCSSRASATDPGVVSRRPAASLVAGCADLGHDVEMTEMLAHRESYDARTA